MSMKLKFTKMHGAGNDFIVVDAINQKVDLSAEQWRRLADRRFGIGADQILVVEKSLDPACDFVYRIFNNDGGEVEQCGNGARAFVKFVTEKGLTSLSSIRVQTKSGIIAPRLEANGLITVDMGEPGLAPDVHLFRSEGLQAEPEGRALRWPLKVGGATEWVSVLTVGNPHAVQVVANVDAAPVLSSGPLVEGHARFPQRINAGFMEVLDRSHIKLRVYERGAGETLACGTGACAAVVAGIERGLLDSPVQVQARGGELSIAWDGPGHSVRMSGPAVTVFEGEIAL